MGSIGTRRFGGVVGITLAVLLFGLWWQVSRAPAQSVLLPSDLPDGYTLERSGQATWAYPTTAETEVEQLKRVMQKSWPQLGRELGAELGVALDLRIAVNPEDMQALAPLGARLPAYATGVAFPEQGIILISLTEPESWLRTDADRVLVHELAHVALHQAAGGKPVPRWLSEGVAIQKAGEHSLARIRVLWSGTLRGRLIPLSRLSESFPSREGEVNLAYAQAADLVGYLLSGEQGEKRFRMLVGAVRSGEEFERAFAASYGMPLSLVEQHWRAGLVQRFGRWPSILSGLTVVWAAAALLLVVGYVRVRRKARQTLKRWEIEEAPLLTQPDPPVPSTAPSPPPRNVADDVLDAWTDQQRRESGVPTIMHEGRSYTLH